MIKKLEEIKKIGAYAINLTFGEGIGADDSDVLRKDRMIAVSYTPVGFNGEGMVYWNGTYKEFSSFDFSSTPEIVSNPPEEEQVRKPGFYTWGTDKYLEGIKKPNIIQ